MSAIGLVLRWGLTLPIIVAVLAVAYRLQQQQPLLQSSSVNHKDAATYCYQGVRTHDTDQPSARCFSVVDGAFKAVWTAADGQAEASHVAGDVDIGVDAPGHIQTLEGYVIPGLWDGHGHLLQYGEFLHSVDLFGSQTLDEVRSRTREYLVANPGAGSKDNWIRGVGWDQTFFGRMPTAADIEQDHTLKGVYLMLDRIDVHCTWVSQAVLDLLPGDLPEVIPGGEIIREPGMGVFCDNAMDLVMDLWPKPGPDVKARHVQSAMRKLNEVGLVGMHDAGATPETLTLFSELAARDDWTLRVYAMLECPQRNSYCPDEAVKFARDDNRFAVQSVKLFADGALGSWGSAMLEPYTDHPWTSGSLLINASALIDISKSWAADGYQVNIHAIGDLANRNAIDALEAALSQQCPDDAAAAAKFYQQDSQQDQGQDHPHPLAACQARHRFRIEHAQIIHPHDQRRIHALGILPSIQPTHATSDMKYALDRLGPERLANSAYRMRSLLPASPVLGSDFPVEPPNPVQGIYAAVARRSPATGRGADGGPEGWYAEEALSLDQALWGFTRAPAYGAFLDGRAGVIREGALADWVVLDRPLDSYDVEDLRTLTVKETWVAGKRVYVRPA
ncbi:amidohydrolase family-domain-containing protein [Dactylonectria estremocensis]|uniref:Amidohydrolase family-domain-containing protein n=1 Tax=Dactylonectria estremocensis TaxID=1079267 RepID=A0A9P9J604_9HYPO|nr:amidohydrolase family-domain-containing protein [Dactylonectria estremocensis]